MEQIQRARSETSSLMSSVPGSPRLSVVSAPPAPISTSDIGGEPGEGIPVLPPRRRSATSPIDPPRPSLQDRSYTAPERQASSGGLSPQSATAAGSRRLSGGSSLAAPNAPDFSPLSFVRVSSFGVPIPPEFMGQGGDLPVPQPYNPAYPEPQAPADRGNPFRRASETSVDEFEDQPETEELV